MPKIILEHITKKWGDFVAVNDLNLVIEEQDFVSLLGPSGCGKTTTLRMIAGLETPTSGKITIGEKVVFDSESGVNITPDKRDVGFLFQNYALWPHMTVKQNIAFGLENLKWKKPDIEKRVKEMLQLLKIEEFEKRYPAEISGGQQQRVAIARTLATSPKVLFMDEPLSNLDAKLRSEMRTELKRLHKDTQATIVYVTHDQLEAMTLSTKICLMSNGNLQQYSAPLVVYKRPANLFVADFVGNPSMNFIQGVAKTTSGNTSIVMLNKKFDFVSKDKFKIENKDVVIGIRPEAIDINEKGKIQGSAFATLPSGVETTIKMKIGEEILTSLKFGCIDYPQDAELKFDLVGEDVCLFDKESGNVLAYGSLKLSK